MRLPVKAARLYITEFNIGMDESTHRNSIDADNRRFLPDEVFETVDDARKAIAGLIENYDKNDGPLVYPVCLNDGTHIGHVEASPLSGGWEIGYHVARAFTGNGYASEAVAVFLPYVMRRLGISQMLGICRADDPASGKVLGKCGFILEFTGDAAYQGEIHRICRYKYMIE